MSIRKEEKKEHFTVINEPFLDLKKKMDECLLTKIKNEICSDRYEMMINIDGIKWKEPRKRIKK